MKNHLSSLAFLCFFCSQASYAQDAGAEDSATESETDAEIKSATAKVALDQAKANLEATQIKNATDEQALKAAKLKNVVDAFPASSTSGAAAAGEGAGSIEAAVMSAAAMRSVAGYIAADAHRFDSTKAIDPASTIPCEGLSAFNPVQAPPDRDKDGKDALLAPIAITTGSTSVDFSHFALFRFKACAIAQEFSSAGEVADRQAPNKGGGPDRSFAAVGAVVSIVTKLIQLMTPDWNISSVTVSYDDRALASAFAARYLVQRGALASRPLIWPQQVGRIGGSPSVYKSLNDLAKADESNQLRLARVKKNQAEITAVIEKDKKAKRNTSQNEQTAKDLAALAERLEAASKSLTSFLASMDSSAEKAALPINVVNQEATLQDSLGSDGLVLTLAVDKAGGSLATRKTFWNVFGGMPYFVSGGAVVDYQLIRPSDQAVLTAGLMGCLAPQTGLNKVTQFNGASLINSCES